MIHTPRHCACPPDLTANADSWTRRFHKQPPPRQWATTKARRLLRPILRDLAYGKCVYCESTLELTGYVEIDHYIPKTVDPQRVFEWKNLLPACRRCNGAKGEQDHRGVLLKPDAEDPEPFFWIDLATGKLEPHQSLDAAAQKRAAETIRICDLQRPALCKERIRMWKRVGRWLDHFSTSLAVTPEIAEEWRELLDPGSQYKFVLRHVLTLKQQPHLAELDRQAFRPPR